MVTASWVTNCVLNTMRGENTEKFWWLPENFASRSGWTISKRPPKPTQDKGVYITSAPNFSFLVWTFQSLVVGDVRLVPCTTPSTTGAGLSTMVNMPNAVNTRSGPWPQN